MAFLAPAAGLLFGVAGLAGKLLGGKKKDPVQALPNPSRDDAAAAAARDDELNRRRGAASDMLVNGAAGGEAVGGAKLIVGS